MPPAAAIATANAAPPPSPPHYAVALAPHHLGFPPPLDGPPLSSPSGTPCLGFEPVPLTEDDDDMRTPGSAEFFLREPPDESSDDDDDTASAHTAFTYQQQLQLRAQLYVSGDLRVGIPPAERTMVHAFGGSAAGQKHVWQKLWRTAVDRWETQNSLVSGYDTPPTSSLIGSCTSKSKDTTVCKTIISEPHSSELHYNSSQLDGGEEAKQVLDVGSPRSLPEKHTKVLKQQTDEEAAIILEPNLHAGGEEASQVLDFGSARGPPEKHTEVLEQQSDEKMAAISEPEQHARGEDVRQGVDVGSARSHPLVNITEHYCNLAFHDRDSETRSLSKKKQDPCVKCGKEGQLLKCRTCPLAAHGSCFGSSVRFDDSGLFDCPVCLFNKADEAYEKAKIARSEARKNLSAFFCSDQSVEQHNENKSVKQGKHQSEAGNLSHKDTEPVHEKRNATSNACPAEVVAEKTTTFGPNPGDANAHEVGNSGSSQEVPHSPHNRLSPVADHSIEAGRENGLMNSSMTHGRRVRFHIKKTVLLHSYDKASGRQDQFMHSARKRCYAQPPECSSSPATPAARSPLGSTTRRHGMSTGRRRATKWTSAEEAALREGMAKYFVEHPGAAAGQRNISWVRILEEGADSFNPVRVPCDLRKKWGRMKQQGRAL